MGAIGDLGGNVVQAIWLALLAFIVCSEASLLAMEAAGSAGAYSENGVAKDGIVTEYRRLESCESYHTDHYFLGIHDCPSRPILTHALFVLNFGRIVIGLSAAMLTEYAIAPLNARWPYSGLTFILATTALFIWSVYATFSQSQNPWTKTMHRLCLYSFLLLTAIMSYRFSLA